MQLISSDGVGGDGIQLLPKSGTYKNLVLWLHGLGETADEWAPLMAGIELENTKFVLPTATSRLIALDDNEPMPAWSNVYGLTREDREDREGFDESADRIHVILQQEIDKGVQPSRIILAGFSQGGAEALHAGLRCPHTLGGVIALSTWLPLRADYPEALSSAARNLPILQVHGDHDENVEYAWGMESHDLLVGLNINPEPQFVTIKDMIHGSGPEEMEIVKEFMRNIFTSADS